MLREATPASLADDKPQFQDLAPVETARFTALT